MAKVTRRAFPDAGTFPTNSGMTLREWYAGMAMQAIIQTDKTAWANGDASSMAKLSFQFADAMMSEVDKREENQNG